VAREGDVWVVVNWGKRQYESDNTTERVARWREAKRAEKAPAARPYKKEGRNVAPTLQQRSGNVSRNVAVTDQNTETESESTLPLTGERAPDKPDAPARAEKHPACRIYRQLTRGALNPARRGVIEKAIPEDADAAALERWEAAVTAWIGRGYRKENVSGMLEWFRGGVPSGKQPPSANGHVPKQTASALSKYAE
jgi:hypothetical protein